MSLQPGVRLGPYEIESAIGAGGMGEVYRARDTRLDRTVALKILPESLAADPHFRERFDREARVISSLDHPHICTLYDVGEQDGTAYLVMQHLEGETLAERLARAAGARRAGPFGPAAIGIDDALRIAIQIAGALDAAHRAGIVHRDLKPGNIMLVGRGGSPDVRRGGPSGPPAAKLLDFGLAKVAGPAVAVTGSMAPTTPPSMTAQGTILGTFQYMAPEQIEGLDADARTDIFAFGAVLFEMLAGRPAFEGKTRASLLGAILKDEPPPVSTLRPDAPPALDRIVAACLAKEADDRWQTARDLLRELKWAADGTIALDGRRAGPFGLDGRRAGPFGPAESTGAGLRAPRWMRALPWAAAGVFGVALAAVLAVWAPWRTAPPAAPMRFAIVPPPSQPLEPSPNDRQIAISPDGTRLAYVAAGNEGPLFVRAFDQLEAEPLRGITAARNPFFSPDGRWVGFFERNELKKVSVTGGPPVTLCEITQNPRGATWGPDDTIVFATSEASTGLMRVAAGGGEPTVRTKADAANGRDHFYPFLLPGGRAVLFTIAGVGVGTGDSEVAVLDLDTGEQKTLIRGASSAEYVETGHLVYGVESTLRAVRFDAARLELVGDPVPVVEEVHVAQATGAADFGISRAGALAYVPAGAGLGAAVRSLVWVDRQGREEAIKAPPRAYFTLRLSPDATRAALDVRDEESDVWIWDFSRQTLTRLTFDRTDDIFPVWTPDGTRIVFRRVGGNALWWRAADGTGTEERLRTGGFPMSFAPDGKNLVVRGDGDLELLPLDGKGQSTPLMQTTFAEGNAEHSPDGRWLAYQSNESGQNQIYVRPFPGVNSGRWQVSPSGGTHPAWARSGGELFYRDAAGALTAVSIQTTPSFTAGNPMKLFETRYHSAVNMRSYDVSPDGRRFLMIKDVPAANQQTNTTPASIVVVLNWVEELKAKLP